MGCLGGGGLLHIQYLYQNLFFVITSFLYIILYKCITISKCVLIKTLTETFCVFGRGGLGPLLLQKHFAFPKPQENIFCLSGEEFFIKVVNFFNLMAPHEEHLSRYA